MDPRLLDQDELAAYLGLELSSLKQKMRELQENGFPDPIWLFNRWDRKAVDFWLDDVGGYSLSPTNRIGPVRLPQNRRSRAPNPDPPDGFPTSPDPGSYTVSEAIADYLREFRGRARTLRSNRYQANAYILPQFGHLRVSELRAEEIRDWMNEVASRQRRVRTKRGAPQRYAQYEFDEERQRRRRASVNRTLGVFKGALNHAFRNGKVAFDTEWRRVQPFPNAGARAAAFLKPEQCEVLVRYCDPDFRKIVQAALLTGARYQEILRIRPKDFNASAGSVAVFGGKTNTPRQVILTNEGVQLFEKLSAGLEPDDLIFYRSDGRPWNSTDPYPKLEAACELAGIKPRVTVHQLRHTYASIAAMNDIPMAVIARNLGHKSVENTEKYYAHLTDDHVANTIRRRMPDLGIVD